MQPLGCKELCFASKMRKWFLHSSVMPSERWTGHCSPWPFCCLHAVWVRQGCWREKCWWDLHKCKNMWRRWKKKKCCCPEIQGNCLEVLLQTYITCVFFEGLLLRKLKDIIYWMSSFLFVFFFSDGYFHLLTFTSSPSLFLSASSVPSSLEKLEPARREMDGSKHFLTQTWRITVEHTRTIAQSRSYRRTEEKCIRTKKASWQAYRGEILLCTFIGVSQQLCKAT